MINELNRSMQRFLGNIKYVVKLRSTNSARVTEVHVTASSANVARNIAIRQCGLGWTVVSTKRR